MRPGALDPGLSTRWGDGGRPETLDWFLDRGGTSLEERTVEHARYRVRTAMAPHVIAGDLPVHFVERQECARYPLQVVWANDDGLEIVVHEGIIERDGVLLKQPVGRLFIEVWVDEDGYHDRLDELAGLVTQAGEVEPA